MSGFGQLVSGFKEKVFISGLKWHLVICKVIPTHFFKAGHEPGQLLVFCFLSRMPVARINPPPMTMFRVIAS